MSFASLASSARAARARALVRAGGGITGTLRNPSPLNWWIFAKAVAIWFAIVIAGNAGAGCWPRTLVVMMIGLSAERSELVIIRGTSVPSGASRSRTAASSFAAVSSRGNRRTTTSSSLSAREDSHGMLAATQLLDKLDASTQELPSRGRQLVEEGCNHCRIIPARVQRHRAARKTTRGQPGAHTG